MRTLLIVDDEMPQVRALCAIIGKMRTNYDIVACSDGEDAWQTVQSRPVDALITDIRMPNMDGMELIERVHRFNPQLQLILLSGYGQFEYAQEAIRCNVLEYLIKPIGQDAISQIIDKLEAKWEEDRLRISLETLYRGTLWRKLCERKVNSDECAELKKTAGKDGPGLVLALDMPEEMAASYAKGELERELEERFSVLGAQTVFHSSPGSRYVVGLIWLSTYYANKISESYGKISTLLEEWGGLSTTGRAAGISNVHPLLFEGAADAYEEARLAVSHAFYEPTRTLIRYAEIYDFVDPVSRSSTFPTARLEENIRSGSRRQISEDIHQWMADELAKPRLSPEQFKSQCVNELLFVLNKLDDLIPDVEKQRLADNVRHRLAGAHDWMELRSRLTEWLHELSKGIEQLLVNVNGVIIKRCLEYMQTHYKEDLSLEHVSAKFNFNASYFSNYFRTKTGTRFSAYLLGIRVDRAKEMLLNSTDKIEDIAIEVGFRNTAYFIRMFKRETGVSPAAFRRLAGSR